MRDINLQEVYLGAKNPGNMRGRRTIRKKLGQVGCNSSENLRTFKLWPWQVSATFWASWRCRCRSSFPALLAGFLDLQAAMLPALRCGS